MSTLSYDYIIQNGIVADGDHLMHDLNQIKAIINGDIDFDNLKAALVNAANGIVKLDANAKIPLDLIPDVLEGKTLNMGEGQTLQHHGIEIITADGKVKHAVYG